MEKRLGKRESRMVVTWAYTLRSSCDRLHTATTLWSPEPENRLLSAGYNGAPSGLPSCDEVGHFIIGEHCLRTNHGEENAIFQCRDLGSLKSGTATVIGTPCYSCARRLVSVGVRQVEYIGTYENAEGIEELDALFHSAQVECLRFGSEDLFGVLMKAFAFSSNPGGIFKSFFTRDQFKVQLGGVVP